MPRSRIIWSHCNSMFKWLRNCQIVFQSACTFFIPIKSVWGLLISPRSHQHLLFPSFLFFFFFESGHPSECEVVSQGAWFAFPGRLMMVSIFSCSYCHLYIFSGEMSIQVFCAVFTGFSFYYRVMSVLHTFCILISCQMYDLQIFSPIPWVGFSLS